MVGILIPKLYCDYPSIARHTDVVKIDMYTVPEDLLSAL
jgi:hypothetical protein